MVDLIKLPAFLLAVYAMYWSLPLANLFIYIKAWKLLGRRNDVFHWCRFLVNVLGIKFRRCGSRELYRGGPCMYLSNHRSWADFFVDAYLTEGRGQLLSRMAVLYAFPMFMLPVVMVGGCIVFKRESIKDKEAFNRWIDGRIKGSPSPGLCLFPEGTRSRLARSLPLKRGMLHYAYSRGMPVQVVMTAHKELALDEKSSHVRFGTTCVTGYGEVVPSEGHDTFEEFFAALQASWDQMWLDVFSADPAALPPLKVWPQTSLYYPPALKASQLGWTLAELALMAWGLVWSWRCWQAAAAWLAGMAGIAPGPALQALQLLPLAWLAVSVVCCWDSTLPKPMLAPDGSVLNEGKPDKKAKAS